MCVCVCVHTRWESGFLFQDDESLWFSQTVRLHQTDLRDLSGRAPTDLTLEWSTGEVKTISNGVALETTKPDQINSKSEKEVSSDQSFDDLHSAKLSKWTGKSSSLQKPDKWTILVTSEDTSRITFSVAFLLNTCTARQTKTEKRTELHILQIKPSCVFLKMKFQCPLNQCQFKPWLRVGEEMLNKHTADLQQSDFIWKTWRPDCLLLPRWSFLVGEGLYPRCVDANHIRSIDIISHRRFKAHTFYRLLLQQLIWQNITFVGVINQVFFQPLNPVLTPHKMGFESVYVELVVIFERVPRRRVRADHQVFVHAQTYGIRVVPHLQKVTDVNLSKWRSSSELCLCLLIFVSKAVNKAVSLSKILPSLDRQIQPNSKS